MQNDMGMTTWEIYYEKKYYMGLDHAYYKLWKLQAYLIKHMSKHYCCDQDLAWVLLQDNSY